MKTNVKNHALALQIGRGRLEVVVLHPKKTFLEKVSDSAPIVISILALAMTIVSQWETMHHNKLSVRPHIGFLTEDNFGATRVGLFIENNGLGPARIERLSVYFDGHRVALSEMDSIYDQTRDLFKGNSPQWYASDYSFHMKSGDRLGVFFSPPTNIKNVSSFGELINERLFVIGEACSSYEECHYFCTKFSDDDCLDEEQRLRSRPVSKIQKKT